MIQYTDPNPADALAEIVFGLADQGENRKAIHRSEPFRNADHFTVAFGKCADAIYLFSMARDFGVMGAFPGETVCRRLMMFLPLAMPFVTFNPESRCPIYYNGPNITEAIEWIVKD